MKPENKILIKTFFTTGLIYALLMAGFNYYDGQEFKVFKFLFHFFFFGLSMGLLARYNHKKQIKKRNEKDTTKTDTKTEE